MVFNSFISNSTLKENEFSPQKSMILGLIPLDTSAKHMNPKTRKGSQVLSIGSDTRVYTPDQLQQIYDESIIKYKNSNLNSSINSK